MSRITYNRKESEKKNIYVQLNHFAMYLKLTLYCKSAILIIILKERVLWYCPQRKQQKTYQLEWQSGGGSNEGKWNYSFIYHVRN